jgi:hypothetical protein
MICHRERERDLQDCDVRTSDLNFTVIHCNAESQQCVLVTEHRPTILCALLETPMHLKIRYISP